MIDLFFMSPPGPSWQLRGRANFRSASAPQVVASAAIREWVGLADALEARGGRVVCLVPPRDTLLTGLPYAAECGHVVEVKGELRFLLPNMAAPHRQGEKELWRALAGKMGIKTVDLPSGVWEAQGDVAEFQGRTILFYGGRTDRAGLDGVIPYFPDNALVIEVREPAFHGNMALLPLDAADRLIVCPDVIEGDGVARLEDAFGREALYPVSVEEIRRYATNGLPVGSSLLAPHLTPARVVDYVRSLGIEVMSLPMVELCEKAGGASRCLVSRARVAEGRLNIPEEHDYRAQRARILADA